MPTLSEMRDDVLNASKRAGLTDADTIDRYLNDSYRETVARTRPLVVSESVTLTAGQNDYSVSTDWLLTDVVSIRNLSIADAGSDREIFLERVTPEYMLMLRERVTTATGLMAFYSFDGLDSVSFYPGPTVDTTGLTVTCVRRPALLVLDADEPEGIPFEFHDVIVLGAIARAVRIWNPIYGQNYLADYWRRLLDYRKWLNQQGGAWNAKAVVVGTRRRRLGVPNDVYFTGMR